MDTHKINELIQISKNIRKSILKMNHVSNASHTGCAFSIVELLVILYFDYLDVRPELFCEMERDRFILSKGHASSALYATLAEKKFFEKSVLDKFYIDGGVLPGHIDMTTVPGLECSTGSLGHGLSIGLGMAIAANYHSHKSNMVVLVGDGELNEGSVWEAIMLAPHLQLKNITLIVDSNKIQSLGSTKDILDLGEISSKFSSFNWDVIEIDGHDLGEIKNALDKPILKPKAIIANTVKGKGVSFMENQLKWHYSSPNKEELEIAYRELE